MESNQYVTYSSPICVRCNVPGRPERHDPDAPDSENQILMRCGECSRQWPSAFEVRVLPTEAD